MPDDHLLFLHRVENISACSLYSPDASPQSSPSLGSCPSMAPARQQIPQNLLFPPQLEGFPFHLLFPSLLFQATKAFLKLFTPPRPFGLLTFRKPKLESFCFSPCHLPPRSKGHTVCYLLKSGVRRRTSNSFDTRQKCRLQGQLMWRRK